jgi:hypothetical protein
MGLHQREEFYTSNNYHSKEAAYRMGENVYQYSSDRGFTSRIYKELKN